MPLIWHKEGMKTAMMVPVRLRQNDSVGLATDA